MANESQITKHLFHLSFLILLGSALFLASCSEKQLTQNEPDFIPTPGKSYTAPQQEESKHFVLENAYFDYDKATLKNSAKKVLRKNALWLKKNTSAEIQIEGDCDERGSFEYNLNLGQKRAEVTKKFLIQQGVESGRINIVSRGSLEGSTEKEMAKNRRAGFLVYFKD